MQEFDVIVVGGGPGGSTCAALLGKKGYKVLLLEKAKFPRDKTCGDAISGKSIKVLNELGLESTIEQNPHSKIRGVAFSSPNGTFVDIAIPATEDKIKYGYVSRREVYDNLLFQNACIYATVIQKFQVTEVLKNDEQVVGVKGKNLETNQEQEFRCKILVGADGATSVVASKLGLSKAEGEHTCVAVRAYYENVSGMSESIELHFIDEVIPGYFWIFPLENNLANVGVGMLLKDLNEKHVNLQQSMYDAIQKNPIFKERFKNAKQVTPVKGWNLPCGSKHQTAHGNGFVLVGDAASLIDPFTGEGIGNAMTSASLAAKTIEEALQTGDYSAKKLGEYEDRLWKLLGPELHQSHRLQRLGKHKFLLNFVIGKAAKSKHVRNAIAGTFTDQEAKQKYFSPLFYLRLLLS